VLSKKLAAGATHVVIDVPVGETAKVRGRDAADALGAQLCAVGARLGIEVAVEVTDGREPVGRGIGPALEARDVLAVLQCDPAAPPDLRDRATRLAGRLLEIAGVCAPSRGRTKAIEVIDTGLAWRKFEAICRAQGGLREPPSAGHRKVVSAQRDGEVARIDNRRLARIAKLAGAPGARAAGVEIAVRLGQTVATGEPLYTVHAETPGELAYALRYLSAQHDVIRIGEAS
jgi:thymidine phosphorylase